MSYRWPADVTNVVNLSQKTTIFSQKAVGLTTFVTTDRKTPPIDDVCNNTHRTDRRDWLRCPRAAAGPGRTTSRRAEPHISNPAPQARRAPEGPDGLTATPLGGGGAWPGFEPRAQQHVSDPAPLVWKAPEGPEGTGGLRGAAPNEVRPPSLAGGRALRRPEHQRGHKQQPAPHSNPQHAHTPSRA